MERLRSAAANVCASGRFGPCSAVALVKDYPNLLCVAAFTHPHKAAVLLLGSQVDRTRYLLSGLQADKLKDVLSELFCCVPMYRINSVLVPLLNNRECSETLANVMSVLNPSTAAALLNESNTRNLEILLTAPSNVLVGVVSNTDSEHLHRVLIPLLSKEESFLEDKLLPFLNNVRDPEYVASVVNHTETDVLFWFLMGCHGSDACDPLKLAALLNACAPSDFLICTPGDLEPTGAVVALLKELADHRGLVRKKVVPLISEAEPEKMARLVQGVKADQLLKVLYALPLDQLVLLITHTNADFVVRIFNGPLESTVSTVAGITAGAMRNPIAAQTVEKMTDNLNTGLKKAEVIVEKVVEDVNKAVAPVVEDVNANAEKVHRRLEKVVEDVNKAVAPVVEDVNAHAEKVHRRLTDFQTVIADEADKAKSGWNKHLRRGKEERGASNETPYRFGDLTRGFLSNKADEIKNITNLGARQRGGSEPGEHRIGDFPRGVAELAKEGFAASSSSGRQEKNAARSSSPSPVSQERNSIQENGADVPVERIHNDLAHFSATRTRLGDGSHNGTVDSSSLKQGNFYSGPSDIPVLETTQGDAFPKNSSPAKKIVSDVFTNMAQVAKALNCSKPGRLPSGELRLEDDAWHEPSDP